MADWPPDPGLSGEHPAHGPFLFPAALPDWRAWLELHHAARTRLLLVLPRPGSGLPGLTIAEAADEALCWGWTDGRPAALDSLRWALTMTPRPVRQPWSEAARNRAEALAAAGRMSAAGLATIEAARRDGAWTGLAAVEALRLPVDLLRPLAADPAAAAAWAALPVAARDSLLHWVQDAPRQSVRAERVRRVVSGLKGGNPPRIGPDPSAAGPSEPSRGRRPSRRR
ncbi:MAG: YdeI/OmpD-associated family protein [Chloroflexota bacterium]